MLETKKDEYLVISEFVKACKLAVALATQQA